MRASINLYGTFGEIRQRPPLWQMGATYVQGLVRGWYLYEHLKRRPSVQANIPVAFCQTDNGLDFGPTQPPGLVPLCSEQ